MMRLLGILTMLSLLWLAPGCRSACQKKQSTRTKLLTGTYDFGKKDTRKYKRINRRGY